MRREKNLLSRRPNVLNAVMYLKTGSDSLLPAAVRTAKTNIYKTLCTASAKLVLDTPVEKKVSIEAIGYWLFERKYLPNLQASHVFKDTHIIALPLFCV
jgi:hypothetical protein